MARYEVQVNVAVGTTLSASDPIEWEGVDGGHFDVTSGSTATISWYTSKDGTTYKPAYEDGSAVQSTSLDTSNDFPIPTTLNGRGRYLKAVAETNAGVISVGKKRASI